MRMDFEFSVLRVCHWMEEDPVWLYNKCNHNNNWLFWVVRLDARMQMNENEIFMGEALSGDSLEYRNKATETHFIQMKKDFQEFLDYINNKNFIIKDIVIDEWQVSATIIPTRG